MSVDQQDRTAQGVEEPIDGLDGDIQIAPGQLAHKLFAFFYNKKTGLILILAAGLLTMMGVLFQQMPDSARESAEIRADWLESVRPKYGGWTNILDGMGLFHVFSSIPFIVVMTLLAISILACTFHRYPLLYQAAMKPHVNVTSSFLERARLHNSWTTSRNADEVADIVRDHAGAMRGVRLIESDRGPGHNFYLDRNQFAPFGTVIAHIAMVIIMIGFLVSSFFGFRDTNFTLTIGQSREVGHGTGMVAVANSFQDTYYENGSPKDYVSDLVITRDGQQIARKDIRVNEPLTVNGVTFHQSYFGIAAVVKVADTSGRTLYEGGVPLEYVSQDETLNYGILDLPESGVEVYVIGNASGQMSGQMKAGQMQIIIYPRGTQQELGSATVDQGQSKTIDKYAVSFEREQQFTGLQVKKDPGQWIVWLGSALLALGTCITMFLKHHRIWMRITEAKDGQTLVQMASPDRNDLSFTRRFNEIGERLTGASAPAVQGEDR